MTLGGKNACLRPPPPCAGIVLPGGSLALPEFLLVSLREAKPTPPPPLHLSMSTRRRSRRTRRHTPHRPLPAQGSGALACFAPASGLACLLLTFAGAGGQRPQGCPL